MSDPSLPQVAHERVRCWLNMKEFEGGFAAPHEHAFERFIIKWKVYPRGEAS